MPSLPALLAEVGATVELPSLGAVLLGGADWQTEAAGALVATLDALNEARLPAPADAAPRGVGSPGDTPSPIAAISARPAPVDIARAPDTFARTPAVSATRGVASGALARDTVRPPDVERTRPAPRWKPVTNAPRPGRSAPGSGATATVAGPGTAGGLGLPIFLALLILAVVLDLARRVALERVTLPSGHWRRPPDTPG
jgi:hypothetical protein